MTTDRAPDFECFVPGIPRPQGSKTRNGNGSMREASKYVKAWRTDVAATALYRRMEMRIDQFDGPLMLGVVFLFHRPRAVSGAGAHWRTCEGCKGRNWRARAMQCTICDGSARRLRADAPVYMTGKPDKDKLVRAVGDALVVSGVVRDDSLFVKDHDSGCKRYSNPGEQPGAWIRIWKL